MIRVENIKKSYGKVEVLKGVNLSVEKGEIVSIVGRSGAGKSTLLHLMGGLDVPTSGQVFYNEIALDSFNEKKLSQFRNQHIGFVFQFHHLLPEFTAKENVMIPALMQGKSKKEVNHKALELLAFMHLEHRINHKPSELSGGEQQRVAVARALINNPGIIMADEPSGNLDSASGKELHDLIFKLREESNQTFIIVTHNTELAKTTDRKIEMQDGRIV